MANSPKRPCTICRRKTKSGEQPCIDIGAAVRCNLTIEEDHSDKGEQEPRQRVSRPNGGHQCLLPEPTHQCNSKDNEEAAKDRPQFKNVASPVALRGADLFRV